MTAFSDRAERAIKKSKEDQKREVEEAWVWIFELAKKSDENVVSRGAGP